MAAAQSNPSPHVIRTAAIAVGFEFDSVPARYHYNVEGGKASTHTGQGVNNQQITETVEEEEDMCEANDTKYLLQSHEEISYEERVQMSLLLPEEKEMMQHYDPSEIFPDFSTLDETIFQATRAKTPS
ncbi:hypothetical protein SUGI_0297650 [Cryptomeria japonica]|nr:hypothetical protein SUGI_0297650 [Cryptomeria japonica]